MTEKEQRPRLIKELTDWQKGYLKVRYDIRKTLSKENKKRKLHNNDNKLEEGIEK